MKDTSKPTASKGRFFFALAILVCLQPGNAVEINTRGFVSVDIASPTAPPTIELSAIEFREQLKQTNRWPIKAIVLDMDGVVTPNSGALWTKLGQEFLRSVAPGWGEGDLLNIKWKSLPEVHRWLIENRGAQLSYEDYVKRREALAARIYGMLANLEPTLLETRDALRVADTSVALASANTRFSVDSMIRRFYLEDAFDATASSEELAPDKTHLGKSATHLMACQRLGVPPHRALAVEDTRAGIEAAKKVGMITAGFRNSFNDHEDLSSANFVIRRLRDLLHLF